MNLAGSRRVNRVEMSALTPKSQSATMQSRRQRLWRIVVLSAIAGVALVIVLNRLLPSDEVVYWVSVRPTGPAPGCACLNMQKLTQSVSAPLSNCGPAADHHGPEQNVVSYSFFGNINSTYFSGLSENAQLIQRLYPGWRIRVYTDVTPEWSTAACRLACNHENLDFCDVRALPGLGDLTPWFGMIWRFMVLGDPSVSRFIIRDSDSAVTEREVAAVQEWISSNRTWHVMRDHPQHRLPIMGGMWGAINQQPAPYGAALREKIIEATRSHRKQEDQKVLERVVWPVVAAADVLQHDSYWCATYPGSRAFPSRRPDSRSFVGAPTLRLDGQTVPEPCPLQCRPPQHTDWTYC